MKVGWGWWKFRVVFFTGDECEELKRLEREAGWAKAFEEKYAELVTVKQRMELKLQFWQKALKKLLLLVEQNLELAYCPDVSQEEINEWHAWATEKIEE